MCKKIIDVNQRRWEIEESFRIMKSEFNARPVFHSTEEAIKAHFLICFLSLTIYRYLEKKLDEKYTVGDILDTLYIGGGTPTSLNEKELTKLFSILKIFKLNEEYEYTFEANILDINEKLLSILKIIFS